MDESLLRYDKKSLIVFIDLETLCLNLSFRRNRAWQVSMIKVRGDQIIEEADILVHWNNGMRMSPGAARVTGFYTRPQSRYDGLTMSEVVERDGVTPDVCFDRMKSWLEEADYIGGHNLLGFDMHLVSEWYRRKGLSVSHLLPKVIDTFCLSKAIKLGMKMSQDDDLVSFQYKMYHTKAKGIKSRLGQLGEQYEIDHDYDNLHDALVDLQLNVKVWNKIKWEINV